MNIMRSMRGAVAVLVGLTLISGAVAIGSWGGVPRPLLAGPTIHDFGVVDLPPEESVELKHVFRLTKTKVQTKIKKRTNIKHKPK